ncbi:hypothetical protein HH308_22640 [Gordonia sp. TBRC 11910]|uniref:Nucleic acid-binding protein n=1 Tax=Gordonia asplenii TaxID=2725283 RepID=A0A848KZK8_9ACTN|nr:hypothetical protein [Gordonia asplenii]NMO04016.1 hypothetical protein [Gordonia asplenii]
MDTSTFTHFCRAKQQHILEQLAPQGLILIPDSVDVEVERGRDVGYEIPSIDDLPWVERGVLTSDEEMTQVLIKVDMPSKRGDGPGKNLGECAVLACAVHRGMVAVVDDGDARGQAAQRNIPHVSTMWIIAQAHKTLDVVDSEGAEVIYDALLTTGMRLPGPNFIDHAYKVGLLP